MGVPISAMGIASGRTCCHCSPTAVSVNTRRSPLHITAHMSVRGEDMAGSWGEGFMLGCSARRGQHIHTLQRGHLIGPAKAFFEGGTQQSARADTALCFASDSVSDPDAEGPDSTADSASDSDSDFSQQNGQQGSSNYSASGYTAHDLRVLWDSVGRPLLRVGRAGVQKSHGTSLADLLSQHALVKVQLNAASAKPDAVGSELGEAAGAVLLQCKGRTLLMASGKDGLFTLLAAAGQSVQQSAAARQRKLEVREQARQGPPELKAAVALRLRVLEAAAVIALSDFDAISIRALSALPEAAALKILEPCNKKSMRAVRNRSAWLTSQCRRLDKPIALPRA